MKKKRVCSAIKNGISSLFLYCFSFSFRLSTVYFCWYLYSNSFDTDISIDNLGNLASFDWIFAFYLYVFLLQYYLGYLQSGELKICNASVLNSEKQLYDLIRLKPPIIQTDQDISNENNYST